MRRVRAPRSSQGTSVLCADLGGTKCRFALVTAAARIVAERSVATVRVRKPFLANLEQALAEVLAAAPAAAGRPRAIGIGTAGVIRKDHTRIEYCPNLPLDGFPLAQHLERRFGLPTTLINDGRASAVGEYFHGRARGRDPMLVLFFGTGIGIGLIVGGRPYEGINNAAGEIGHTIHVPNGRTCACGRAGCYEAYCGGGPMCARAAEELGPAPDGAAWTVGQIVTRAAIDPRADRILDEARAAACSLVASACTLLNPAAVVLGGGVLHKAWPGLYEEIVAFVRTWCAPVVTRHLRFARSQDDSRAIMLGAAAATGVLRDKVVIR